MTAVVPPVPASCAGRPTVGAGLVVPWVNRVLADGGVDFRSRNQGRYGRCWAENLCQVCGARIEHRAVLLAGAKDIQSGHIDEPPCCVPCAVYVTQACPMIAGRMPRFADRETLSAGARGHVCPAGCGCAGLVELDMGRLGGLPAYAWFAVFVKPGQWQPTATIIPTRCSDGGCSKMHQRQVANGGLLVGEPLKVMVVSTPGEGRVWRRVTADELEWLLGLGTS